MRTAPKAIPTVTPLTRLVVVTAVADPDGTGTRPPLVEILPVAALAARPDGTDGHTRYDALVADQDFGLIPFDDDLLDGCNTASELAAAPWPPECDRLMLADVMARVAAEAVRKNEDRRRPGREG